MQLVTRQNFRIAGSGHYLPVHSVSAEEMDRRCDKPSGWCRSTIGIHTRYECLAPETMISMGCKAIERALEDAALSWSDVDFIVDCSTSQFRPIPCNAAHYQHAFGTSSRGIPSFDIHSTCLSSLVALNMINGLMGSGGIRNALIVSSESGMGGVDYRTPHSACLIGDGAAALVIQSTPAYGTMGYCHETYAEHIDLCRVDGGGHKRPVFGYTSGCDSEYRFQMDGPAVFRVALQMLKPMVFAMLENWQASSLHRAPAETLAIDELDFIPHQASPRALEAIRKQFYVRPERFHVAVPEAGNLIAASIPWMIDRVRKQHSVASGSYAVAMGTSAGYSQAALLFRM